MVYRISPQRRDYLVVFITLAVLALLWVPSSAGAQTGQLSMRSAAEGGASKASQYRVPWNRNAPDATGGRDGLQRVL